MKLKWGDGLLIVVFIVLAALPFWLAKPSHGASIAIVSQNGIPLQRIDLSRIRDERSFTIKGNYDNTITVSEGAIGFTHSDCPDQICVHSGMISRPGQAAVCLPNRAEIRIEGEGDLDAVSG